MVLVLHTEGRKVKSQKELYFYKFLLFFFIYSVFTLYFTLLIYFIFPMYFISENAIAYIVGYNSNSIQQFKICLQRLWHAQSRQWRVRPRCQVSTSISDYHGEMYGETFTKRLYQKLIPNLLAHSVVVIDIVPYRQVSKQLSTKSVMMSLLQHHNIH
jgi:hypothetical protein